MEMLSATGISKGPPPVSPPLPEFMTKAGEARNGSREMAQGLVLRGTETCPHGQSYVAVRLASLPSDTSKCLCSLSLAISYY